MIFMYCRYQLIITLDRIVLEVLRPNIWYLSQRQAQRYLRGDDTVGSILPCLQRYFLRLYGPLWKPDIPFTKGL